MGAHHNVEWLEPPSDEKCPPFWYLESRKNWHQQVIDLPTSPKVIATLTWEISKQNFLYICVSLIFYSKNKRWTFFETQCMSQKAVLDPSSCLLCELFMLCSWQYTVLGENSSMWYQIYQIRYIKMSHCVLQWIIAVDYTLAEFNNIA